MAIPLPDLLLACNPLPLRRTFDRRLWLWATHVALATTNIVACGEPTEVGTPPPSSSSPDGLSVLPPAATPTTTPGSHLAMMPTQPQATTTQPNVSSTPPAAASNSTNNTSEGNSTKPADTSPASDPPPPTPDIFSPGGSSIPPGSGPLGLETTCDGVDDDNNGVVDDVDATGDGVCDCLKIATLGLHGEWGSGNVVTGWLRAHTDVAAVELDGEPLTAERLQPFHILLIRDVSLNHNAGLSFSAQEAEALWSWVRDGGGVMTVIGYSDADESNNVNGLLRPFGVSYGSEQIVQGMGSSAPVTQWFEHPLSAGITQVGADNGYPVVGTGSTFAAQDSHDVGKALVIGNGHVLVWGDEWVTYEDEWSSDTTYQVEQFWKNAVRWLTRATQCQVTGT